jgi:hypothetical protein
MKHRERANAERQSCIVKLRRAGVKYNGGQDIPFGIRALQSGLQVDGIWFAECPDAVYPYAPGIEVHRKNRGAMDEVEFSPPSRCYMDCALADCGGKVEVASDALPVPIHPPRPEHLPVLQAIGGRRRNQTEEHPRSAGRSACEDSYHIYLPNGRY